MLLIVFCKHFCSFWQYNVSSTYWNSNGNEKCFSHCWFVLYCYKHSLNEQKCLQNTINSINHVLASPIAVFISFIATDNDSARVIACLIHRVLYCYKHSLIRLFNNNCKYLDDIIANSNLNLSKTNITCDSCKF
jgi:hypothetical protein